MRWVALALLPACSLAHEGGWPLECPDPQRRNVHYVHATWDDRYSCDRLEMGCGPEEVFLETRFPRFTENDCGCGCFGVRDDYEESRDGLRLGERDTAPEVLQPDDTDDSVPTGW